MKLLAILLSRQKNYVVSPLHLSWLTIPMPLYELRNLLLLGANNTSNFKFVDVATSKLKQVSTYLPLGGFYGDYGKPNTAIFGNNLVLFWPDDWQRVVGGQKAVGHFVQWFQQSPIPLRKVSDENDAGSNLSIGGWLVGNVVGYERETDGYNIQFDRSTIIAGSDCQQLAESYWEDYQGSSAIKADYTNLSIPLDRVIHLWVDLRYKNKIGFLSSVSAGDERLTFSFADVGAFIKIWWSRYSKHFYGRIVSYDSTRKIHSVVYEDADMRSYDMTTRDYELIVPSQSLSKQIATIASDAEAAKLVSSWHRKKQSFTSDRTRSDSSVAPRVEAAIPRPNAAQNLGISIHQLEVINQFAREGGLESLFQSLSDLNQAPPTCRAIMLNMQLTYQLKKYVGLTRYQDLVWEAKEGIPCALSRYQEAQIKDLTIKEFNDICLAIKDIVVSVESDDPAQKQGPSKDMLVAVEYMRLTIASKLLSCSQLQKRYSGLLMIKDVIDTIFSKLSVVVDKRYQFLGAKRDSKAKGSSPSSSTAAASSSAASKSSLTLAQMDTWLLENDIVKAVFGESLHQDLVARSDIILAYMAQRGILTEQHVELIWSASKGAHEAVSRVLFLLILVLVPTLAPNLRLYLFNLISCTPIKDYTEQLLHFIKSYTIQSIIAAKEESKMESRESSSPLRMAVSSYQQQQQQMTSETAQREKDSPYAGLNAGKKGTVVHAPSRQWLGFGVLWHFIQDNPGAVYTGTSLPLNKQSIALQQAPIFGGAKFPSNLSMIGNSEIIDESLIDVAIQLLVDLLQDEFKEEREVVMVKCLDNIQASMSVPVSLQLLRKTLALYPSQNKGWFGGITNRQSFGRVATIQNQVEKLIKSQKLMEIVFQDLEKYHRSLNDPSIASDDGFQGQDGTRSGGGESGQIVQSRSTQDLAALNDRRIQSNGKFSRTSHLKGIVERLDFLKFIVSRSTVKMNESQTVLLWKALGEKAATVETLEKLCTWIDTLVIREDKQLIVLLSSLSQENDISAPDMPSQLAGLSPTSQSNIGDFTRAENDPSGPVLASAFEDGVLAKLFDEYILKWANHIERVEYLSRPAIARLCVKLFLLVNILSKSIRVNTETGVWIRVGPLGGLPVIWRIAMDGSSNVASTAIVLLIELHHRTNHRLKLSDNIKAVFLRQCFKQLSIAIQSLQSDDFVHSLRSDRADSSPEESNSGAFAPSSIGSKSTNKVVSVDAMEWFEDGEYLPSLSDVSRRVARLVQSVRLFIHRFHFSPTKLVTITVLAGRNESAVCTFSMKASDSVSLLRQKIASHFKDTTDSINLFKYASKQPFSSNGQTQSASPSIVDRDDFSLHQAKFSAAVEYVLVKRKEVTPPAATAQPNDKMKGVASSDAMKAAENPNLSLSAELSLKPLDWLSAYLNRHADKFHENLRERLSYEMFVLPSLPWNAHVDMSTSSTNTATPPATIVAATATKKSDNLARVHDSSTLPTSDTSELVGNPFSLPGCGEVLYNYLQNGAFYNQLLEMLDGYLSTTSLDTAAMNSFNPTAQSTSADFDLSVAVWDILQSLPSHSILVTQVKVISGPQLNTVFDPTSPFRLLYTLQVIESFFAQSIAFCFESTKRSGDNAELMNWAMNFLEIGGAECITNLIHTLSQKIASVSSTDNTSDQKLTVDSRSEFLDMKQDYVMPRKDIHTVLVALSSRILHMLLLLDPVYKNWIILSTKGSSSCSKIFRGSLFDVVAYPDALADVNLPSSGPNVPPGVIFSSIDSSNLTKTLLSVLVRSYDLFREGKITSFAMLTAAENVFILLSGLLTASDIGIELLRNNSKLFYKVIFALCISCSVPIVRQGFCRQIFEVCANIYSKCADPSVSQEEKKSRLNLFDYIFYIVVSCVNKATNSTAKLVQSSHSEQVYCLLACIESLRSSPNLIFPELAPRKKGISNTYPSTSSLDSLTQEEDAMIVDSSILADGKSNGAFREDSFKGSIDVDKICELFARKLVHHKSRETFHSTSPDGALLGILRGLTILAHGDMRARTVLGKLHRKNNQKRSIISFLYVQCLFPDGEEIPTVTTGRKETTTLAACQTRESREYTYNLLYYLCSSDLKNFARLVNVISNQLNLQSFYTHDLPQHVSSHSKGSRAKAKSRSHDSVMTPFSSPRRKSFVPWNYDPSLLVKDGGAYVGLSNQGGTCYMNSFIQQLYHSLNFAGGLLRISVELEDLNKGEDSVSGAKPSEQESMIFQLQVMFGHLKLSQKRFYDTMPFCKSFIDYDGQPISLSEQKDINEFAGMLFDKMEHNKDCMNLLASTIQGKFVWKTRSIESSYRSEREENFYMITAEVKDKSSLENALELNAAEELFSGDNKIEDSNGQKVEASRRCEIRSLPNTLIIHLKRFEFDLETMNRKKVNDYISFPFDLNMYPYTEEGIRAKELKSRSIVSTDFGSTTNIADLSPSLNEHPQSYYQFKLRGVVAHVGAIDRGHYYSFIKERGTQKWYEFNDRLVIPFNPDNIPNECFGGVETVTNSHGIQSSRMRENNAYLLVYEREEYLSAGTRNKFDLTLSKEIHGDHGGNSPVLIKPTLGERVQRLGDSDDESNDYFIDNMEEGNSNDTDEAHTPPKGSSVSNIKPVNDHTTSLDSGAELLASDAIAKQVLDAVWTENTEFQKDRFLFDPIHFRFLWQMLKCASVGEIMERSNSSEEDELQEVLGTLCTVCLRFNVEVVARANGAQQCYLQFFQGIESIIIKDTSNMCAKMILNEITNPRHLRFSSGEPLTNISVDQADSVSFDGSNKDGPFFSSLDSFHPWLIQVYLHYPHTPPSSDSSTQSFPQAFTHLLMVCIRKLRPAVYITGSPGAHLDTMGSSSSSMRSAHDGSSSSSRRPLQPNEDSETVSILVSTLLRLLEVFKIEDVMSNDGKIRPYLHFYY